MSIKAFYSSVVNLPSIASSLINRSYNVIQKNEEAADEAQATLILTTSGCAFGFFGRAVVMLWTNRFSIPSLFVYSLIGFGAGVATSSPAIYSFFSNMKNR